MEASLFVCYVSFLTGWVKSGVTVEFSNPAYLLLSAGDLTVDELDDIVQFLATKSSFHEQRELIQLHNLHSALQRYVPYK